MPAKTMTGARALFQIVDPNSGPITVGIFNSASLGLAYDLADIYVLGRYSADETVYTAQETVRVTCSGWRVIGHGAHQDGKVPHLQDLLNHEYITLQLVDRQTGLPFAKVLGCRPEGYNGSVAARQPSEITITYRGLLVDDESQPSNAESVTTVGTGTLP